MAGWCPAVCLCLHRVTIMRRPEARRWPAATSEPPVRVAGDDRGLPGRSLCSSSRSSGLRSLRRRNDRAHPAADSACGRAPERASVSTWTAPPLRTSSRSATAEDRLLPASDVCVERERRGPDSPSVRGRPAVSAPPIGFTERRRSRTFQRDQTRSTGFEDRAGHRTRAAPGATSSRRFGRVRLRLVRQPQLRGACQPGRPPRRRAAHRMSSHHTQVVAAPPGRPRRIW
jgi:hypothetical protein